VQDRDGAPSVLQASRARFPFIQKVFADRIYAARVMLLTRRLARSA